MEHAIMVLKSSLFSGSAGKVSSLLRNMPRIQTRRAVSLFLDLSSKTVAGHQATGLGYPVVRSCLTGRPQPPERLEVVAPLLLLG